MNFLAIIPARYDSSRLPGKPLIDIMGKSMIQRVYERASEVFDDIVVATDDDRIANEVRSFNGNYIFTSDKHKSGTDRCAEAVLKYELNSGKKFDVVVNIQGDEPFIEKEHLNKIIKCFDNKEVEIATLIKEINSGEEIFDADKVKVLINNKNFAIYFSRSAVPFLRDVTKEDWHKKHRYYKHIGIYAYQYSVLLQITKLERSTLEIAESLEQNRWIENGYKIFTDFTTKESISVDTKNDLKKIIKNFSSFMET